MVGQEPLKLSILVRFQVPQHMNTEIEATFIGPAHADVRRKLEAAGATLVTPERLIRRTIFDYEDLRLDKKAAWIRLRDEGDAITLTFKQRNSETIEGMKEIELVVDDYDKTKAFMLAIGLSIKAEQETKRELWKLGTTEIMLDTWPWLDPITEVEGKDEDTVRRVSAQLGFDWEKAIFDSADKLYMLTFDVTRTEICTVPLTFGPIPAWLEERRRK